MRKKAQRKELGNEMRRRKKLNKLKEFNTQKENRTKDKNDMDWFFLENSVRY